MKLGLWYDSTKNVIYAIRTLNKWDIRNKVDVTEAAIRYVIEYWLKEYKDKDTIAFSVEWSDYMIMLAKKPLVHNEEENE
jgi:hypothetical protein